MKGCVDQIRAIAYMGFIFPRIRNSRLCCQVIGTDGTLSVTAWVVVFRVKVEHWVMGWTMTVQQRDVASVLSRSRDPNASVSPRPRLGGPRAHPLGTVFPYLKELTQCVPLPPIHYLQGQVPCKNAPFPTSCFSLQPLYI